MNPSMKFDAISDESWHSKRNLVLGEDPIVTKTQCFDDLLIPPDHPGRQPSDTYYIDDKTLLRTHTSAHQSEHLRQGYEAFLCTGDVYRRDEIDRSHFPAFHQMEGVKLFPKDMEGGGVVPREEWVESEACKMIGEDLKQTLDGLVDVLFPGCERKWSEDYFPFTEPSFECEVLYEGEWLEILGCGVIHTDVLKNVGMEDRHGWAFGLGLERLAMVLFKIPDIRLFWSTDERFTKQFKNGDTTTVFKPYSKYPPCYKVGPPRPLRPLPTAFSFAPSRPLPLKHPRSLPPTHVHPPSLPPALNLLPNPTLPYHPHSTYTLTQPATHPNASGYRVLGS